MIRQDTLTCEVDPNAIEPRSLSCSVPPLEYLDLWTTVGSLATAIFTLLLGVFAYAAWRSSQRSIKELDRQSRESILASQELAVQSRQIQYLADYCNALMDLSNAAGDSTVDLRPLTARTTGTWATWAMEMFRIDPGFREYTGKWNALLNQMCEELHDQISDEMDSNQMSLATLKRHDHVRSLVGSYFAKLQIWQVDQAQRQQIRDGIISNYREPR